VDARFLVTRGADGRPLPGPADGRTSASADRHAAFRPLAGNVGRLVISVINSSTFSLVDYPNPCHPGLVRQGHAGESHVGSSSIGADGATTPETLRHQDRLAGRSGERRVTASTEGDIRAARRGLISQVPRQMGPIGRLRPIRSMPERGGPLCHTLPLLAPA
jgi:hypothetical protein